MTELSEIQSFYKGKVVFVTGGTGLMGKVLIEKLLYSCSDLNKIYILIRPKRGRTPEMRVDEMFKLLVSMNPSLYFILKNSFFFLTFANYFRLIGAVSSIVYLCYHIEGDYESWVSSTVYRMCPICYLSIVCIPITKQHIETEWRATNFRVKYRTDEWLLCVI